jgi:hypothetical protein
MQIVKTESILTLLSNTVQNGDEKTGASQLLARERVHSLTTNKREEIPFISGNSIRGQLRRVIMSDFLDQVEYKFKTMDAWHAFTGGGQLTQVSDEGMSNLELRRTIDNLLPPAKIWAFSYGNQTISGILTCANAIICCKENQWRIPEQYKNLCQEEYAYFIGHVFFTRRDDTKQHDAFKSNNEDAIQMKVDLEVLNPGTQLYHKFALKDPTKVDIGCLGRALHLWNQLPHLGGKSSTGFGEIQINYTPDLDEIPYLQFLKDKKTEIQKALTELESMFTPKAKKKTTKKGKPQLTLDATNENEMEGDEDPESSTIDSE